MYSCVPSKSVSPVSRYSISLIVLFHRCSILCLIIPHCQLYLNPSLSSVLCQIVMCLLHSFQCFFCLTSWFYLFCVPLPLILDSAFCSVLIHSLWTLLSFSTSEFLDSPYVLLFDLDCLLVLTLWMWHRLWLGLPMLILFAGKLTLFQDFPSVSGIPALHWFAHARTCLTWIDFDKDSLHLTLVFKLGSWPQIPDGKDNLPRHKFNSKPQLCQNIVSHPA